jgi:hypothetical protein
MKSHEFLQAAIDVQAERGKQYDKPTGERSMGATVTAFNTITGRDLSEAEGWLLLQTLKDVRQWQNPSKYHHDSALDGVAYSALKAEALSEESGEYDFCGEDPRKEPSHIISDIPNGYHWDDAPDGFEWFATDPEGAFWFKDEPLSRSGGTAWAWPGSGGCTAIDDDRKELFKCKRPTSTAQ